MHDDLVPLNEDELYEYQERVAIAEDNGAPLERAEELAREQIQQSREG